MPTLDSQAAPGTGADDDDEEMSAAGAGVGAVDPEAKVMLLRQVHAFRW